MYQKIFQKQVIMRRVLIALAPIYLFSLYLYGWRLLYLGVFVFATGGAVEYLFERGRGKKVSEAVLVTCSLFLLALPPRTPVWIAIIGIAFGVTFGKEVFGGFGRNIFNPAITGRLFAYITFPNYMQAAYQTPGRFGLAAADGLSTATPLGVLRGGGDVDVLQLLLGFRTGALGESAILLILAAGVYLIVTNTAGWRIILSTLAGGAALHFGLDLLEVPRALPALPGMMSGSLIMVAVFYATDPVSAPKKKGAQYLYGVLLGSVSVVIRTFSLFPEGTSFAILVANTFASLLDELVGGRGTRKKAVARTAGGGAK